MKNKKNNIIKKKKFSLDQIEELKIIIIVCRPEVELQVVGRLEELGGRVLIRERGEGISKSKSLELLGLQTVEDIVILATARKEDADNLLLALDSEFNFTLPGAGLAFTIDVDGFMGAKGLFV